MDKLQAQFRNENQQKSNLFKQLFHFQIQLKDYSDEHSDYQKEVQEVMEITDRLMERLIESYNFNDC